MNQAGWYKTILGLCWVLGSALAGCTPVAPASEATPSPMIQPTRVAVMAPTQAPSIPSTPTAGILTPTLSPTENITALPLPVFDICTPLQDHPIDQLRLIVADPYRPPPGKSDARHHGVDFSYYRFAERDTIQGVGVQAVIPGQVAAALADSYPFGNLLMIETDADLLPDDLRQQLGVQAGEALYLFYAHMAAAPELRIGDNVEACQLIGAVGISGNTVEPHLHLEARVGPADSIFTEMGEYYPEASPEQRAAYQLWRTSGVYRHLHPMILINFALDRR